MSREEIKKILSELWEALGSLETIQPSSDIKDRFWARVHEEETYAGSSRKRFIRGWHRPASLLIPALAFAALILVMFLGTFAALKVMPQAAITRQNKSSILLWAEGVSGGLKSGGFSL